QREDEGFVDGGIDQRPVFLPFADPQILADQNDLGQDQGVDRSSSVLEGPLAKPTLEQHAVGGKGAEQGREEQENRQILTESWIAFCLSPALSIVLGLPESTPSFATLIRRS